MSITTAVSIVIILTLLSMLFSVKAIIDQDWGDLVIWLLILLVCTYNIHMVISYYLLK